MKVEKEKDVSKWRNLPLGLEFASMVVVVVVQALYQLCPNANRSRCNLSVILHTLSCFKHYKFLILI